MWNYDQSGRSEEEMKAIQIMNKKIVSVESSETLRDALELMEDCGLDELPVVDDECFIGVITASAIHQASQHLGEMEEIPDRPVADLIGYATTCKPKEEGFKVLDHMEQDDSHHSYVVSETGALLGEVDFDALTEVLPSQVNAGRAPRGWGEWHPDSPD